MRIAFYDLDRTLISQNSGFLWVSSELRCRHLSLADAAKAVYWMGRYHLGIADLDEPLRQAIKVYRGQKASELEARTQRFYRNQIRRLFRPGAFRSLADHRAAGDLRILLTTSSCYLAACVVEDLGLDGHLSNRFVVDTAGQLTGEAIDPLCFGPGKLVLAREFAETHGISLNNCSFYTDSTSDSPVLEAVGRPVVVHPDPRLRKLARHKKWPIVSWS